MKAKWQWRFWTAVGVSQVIILISVIALHFLGYVDFARMVQSVIWAVSGIALAYLGYRMQRTRPEPGSSKEKSRMKIAYTLSGSWLGLVIAFFGTPLLNWLSMRLGGPNILRLVDDAFEYYILILTVSAILGAIVGYYFGRNRGFKKPNWMTWLDNRLGF